MSASTPKPSKKPATPASAAPPKAATVATTSSAAVAPMAPVDADTNAFSLVAVKEDDIEEAVSVGTMVAVYNPVALSETALLSLLPAEVSQVGVKGRGMINGVNPTMMFKAFLVSLLAARRAANPVPLIYCGVLAVAIAYTVSREWVDEYSEIPPPHMFSGFEIAGRKKRVANASEGSDDWVEGSNMNAASLRVFGSMIVEAGIGSTFLKQLKTEAGSIFTPPTGDKARDKIMKAAAAEISEADKMALAEFKKHAATYCNLVGAVFGGGSLDVKTYTDVAESMGVVYI